MEKQNQTIATDLNSLGKVILEELNNLRMGMIKEKRADSVANLAGKYIKGKAVQMENRKNLGGNWNIDGLENKKK